MTKLKTGDSFSYTLHVYYTNTTNNKTIFVNKDKLNKDLQEFLINWYKENVDPGNTPYISNLREEKVH